MKQEHLVKQFASYSIEELLSNSSGNEDRSNWLLSYLDVFVLIIMLVITLMAINDYTKPTKTEQQRKQPISSKIAKPKLKHQTTVSTSKSSHQHVSDTKKQIQKEKPELSNDKKVINLNSDVNTSQAVKKIEPPPIFTVPEDHALTNKLDSSALPMTPTNASHTVNSLPGLVDSNLSKLSELENDSIKNLENKEALNTQEKLQDYWQQQLNNKLTKLELNEFVNINVKQGYAEIEIQDNILFESAEAKLTDEGALVLQRLISILKQSAGLIYIEGHTDNQPIKTVQFPSNWELGSARATSVLHFLASQELNQNRLRAVTYADTMPIADNNTETGRRKNRRVNILIKLPEKT